MTVLLIAAIAAVYLLFGLVVWSWCAMAKELEG